MEPHFPQGGAAGASGAGLLPPAGFGDPVFQAQAVFRGALHALAHPGELVDLGASSVFVEGLAPATAALLLALADAETPVWLPGDVGQPARSLLRFHSGCPLAGGPGQARFVVAPAGHAMPALAALQAGSAAYPDRSTTLLLEVGGFDAPAGATLRGPGIRGSRRLAPRGLPASFWTQWRDNHRRFPLGVDVFMIDGPVLCGLPRSTQAQED